MSITKIKFKTQAFTKFLHQHLVPGTGGGYEEYRRILAEEGGLEILIYEWKAFIIMQYFRGWITVDQCYKYMDSLPQKLRHLVTVREHRGDPKRLPLGNPAFGKGNQLYKKGMITKERKKRLLEQQKELEAQAKGEDDGQ